MAYFISTPPVKGAPGEVDSEARNPIGATAIDSDGYEYIYLKGVANTIAGSWVTFDEAGVTAGIDTDAASSVIGPVAIATAAVVANKFGWYGRKGTFSAGAGTVADNAPVFATSTVFIADDAELDDMQILGAVWRSTDSSSLATVQINNPWIGHAVDASA
jgi:hypothetical protein